MSETSNQIPEAAILVKALDKSFKTGFFLKNKKVLDDVSFIVPEKTITGFIGANGSGKTTIFKSLLQVIFPDRGEMKIFGHEINSKDTRRMIGFLPERPYFHDFLTGNEFLSFHGALMGQSREKIKKRRAEVLEQVGLPDDGDKKLGSYSKGMLQRIGIGQALMVYPRLLILDEPMSGLDPDGRLLVKKLIRDIAASGTTVFFSSHLLHDAQELCNYLVCLRKGKVVFNGEMQKLLQRDNNIEVHIQYRKGDGSSFPTLDESVEEKHLQDKIDELRKQGFFILQVEKKHVSLEQMVGKL